jgi:hypothetical protein
MSAWAANTYVKVTSLDQLEAGKKYILVNDVNNNRKIKIYGKSNYKGGGMGAAEKIQ